MHELRLQILAIIRSENTDEVATSREVGSDLRTEIKAYHELQGGL